ncbi:short integuments 2, mitochondrial [Panicum miliaceum]|uniref:Short integuments 2, mitochondrial n=1 Tax=Panicum miliaceum TaxID=4540 RepID=A0A3L6PIE9_PANMI|nr:short integuments 2, mitochondrial [Panicum miliaceum]
MPVWAVLRGEEGERVLGRAVLVWASFGLLAQEPPPPLRILYGAAVLHPRRCRPDALPSPQSLVLGLLILAYGVASAVPGGLGVVYWQPPESAMNKIEKIIREPAINRYSSDDGLPEHREALLEKDLVTEVQRTLCSTCLEFAGNTEEESELESLIDMQLTALRKVFRIPHKPFDETHGPTSKKLLTLFRSGKLGPFILDDLPDEQ